MTEHPVMTNHAEIPTGDGQNNLTVGPRVPIFLQDVHQIEKLSQFNRERIPERVVHAKGSGAYGHFTVTDDITKYTKAKLFSEFGKKTEVFVRFSTGSGERGSADTERDLRGFAIRFYTEEGNWDLVGNNTPVYFIRDPLKFSDFVHAQKRDPHTNLRNPTMMWDFWSLSPESLHQITILFSDRGIPDGYRHMNGYGSHAFSLINANNELFWVKWHFKTMQGIRNILPHHATLIAGEEPDYAQRDLYTSIDRKDFPRWRVYLQAMPEHDADNYLINPFDLTKVWSHKDYPLIEVGEMVLNRNPQNYFQDVEQAAFEPSNIVPGMGFSPDKMLQGRLFSYPDAHRYRIGTNYGALPVNCPHAAFVQTCHRDGSMRIDGNGVSVPNDAPTNYGGPSQNSYYAEPSLKMYGDAARYDHHQGDDHYIQAGNLFRLMAKDAQERLVANIIASLRTVPWAIQARQIGHFLKADTSYGDKIASGLGIGKVKLMAR